MKSERGEVTRLIAAISNQAERHTKEKRALTDRITALEAERDRLREALRITRDRLDSVNHDGFDGVWTSEDFARETREADAALAGGE